MAWHCKLTAFGGSQLQLLFLLVFASGSGTIVTASRSAAEQWPHIAGDAIMEASHWPLEDRHS
jgi:hypothetical protein